MLRRCIKYGKRGRGRFEESFPDSTLDVAIAIESFVSRSTDVRI